MVMPQPPGMVPPQMPGMGMSQNPNLVTSQNPGFVTPPPIAGTGPNPTIDMAQMRDLYELSKPNPVYPSWLKKIPKPNAQKVHEQAIRRFDELALWREAVRHDLEVLRNCVEGIFPDDRDDYYAGILDEW